MTQASALLAPTDRSLLQARKDAAGRLVGSRAAVLARIAEAPEGYAMVHHASEIARHCLLLTPRPGRAEVRVVVTPGRDTGEWHVDGAGRDRPGLLAAITGVLTGDGLDVTQAVVATWDDGAALQALVVRSPAAPDPAGLQRRFEEALRRPSTWSPVADAGIRFDDGASPLYTACEVRATDRPGLLHDITSGMAAVGVDIHAARATTVAGTATDHFDLTDGSGRKLGTPLKAAVHRALRTGPEAAPPARRARRER